jgi:hypothetical protein
MVPPLLESFFLEMATTRDLCVPDVTDGVAQDRKRQEP